MIKLIEDKSEFGLAFETPEGKMDVQEYLNWLKGKMLEIRQHIKAN